jgi:gas vesicle protein GvpL/GvpF
LSGLYLYALLAGEPAGPALAGLAGEPLRFLPCGGFVAAVGEQPAAPKVSAAALAGHDAAVRRLAERVAALLPARFGGWLPDAAALVARLAPHAAEVAAALALVRGCVQMTLRVFGEPLPAAAVRAEPPRAGPGPGARYLAARRQALARERSLPEIAPLTAALAPLLRAERLERHARGRLLGTAYHLVRREDAAAYGETVAGAAALLGGRTVAASGPWPPYAFAPEAAR